MEWTEAGAYLTLPSGKRIKVPFVNNCPCAKREIVEAFKQLKKEVVVKKRAQGKKYKFLSSIWVKDQSAEGVG